MNALTNTILGGATPTPQPKGDNAASALRLASAGLHVFPCDPANKRPLGGILWTKQSTCDAETVARWWRRWPEALVGLDVGKARLVVIDADRHGGPDGVSAIKEIVGKDLTLFGCPIVRTAGNGLHLIFAQPAGEAFGNSSGALPKGIDMRGVGGYIVAAGSTREDGSRWSAVPGTPDLVEAFESGKIPALPSKIVDLIRQRPERSSVPEREAAQAASVPKVGGVGERERAFAATALERNVAELASCGAGGRNELLNKLAFRMARMAVVGWINAPAIRSALRAACEANGYIRDKGQRAFDMSFTSGMVAGAKLPHEPLADRPYANDDAELRAAGEETARLLLGEKYKVAEVTGVAEAPRPLFRELAQASSYPVDALGSILASAAKAIVDRIQCPDALAAQSVLAAASLAVQAHADIEIPATGHVKPISLFMVSVAASGERKSAADGESLWPVRKREKALREAYAADVPEYLKLKAAWDAARKKALDGTKGDKHAIKGKLDEVGGEPPKPLEPMLTCGEPTFEGICKLLAGGQPAMGIFSDEGGSFIGGHGMSPDAKLRTIAGLSGIWDGSPIKRVRALDGSSIIGGKRVALHLMAQPEAAALMLTDPVLLDQGFLSRVLVSAPASTAGTRFQREPDPASGAALSRYHARILSILERQPTLALDSRNELEPRVLRFAPDAANAWRDYADHVEGLLAPGQPFEPIRGFANKLPEHAARIAAVLTLVDNIDAPRVDRETLERAVRLAEYYTREALRLFEAGYASPELRRAEALRKWLIQHDHSHIGLAEIYQTGPRMVRDAATARAAVGVLVDHGWLIPVAGPSKVKGKNVREAWSIVKEERR
jgi:hypothetical protein